MFLLAVFGGELFVRRNCSSVSIHPVLTDVTGHRESSLSPDLSSRISSAGTASGGISVDLPLNGCNGDHGMHAAVSFRFV